MGGCGGGGEACRTCEKTSTKTSAYSPATTSQSLPLVKVFVPRSALNFAGESGWSRRATHRAWTSSCHDSQPSRNEMSPSGGARREMSRSLRDPLIHELMAVSNVGQPRESYAGTWEPGGMLLRQKTHVAW